MGCSCRSRASRSSCCSAAEPATGGLTGAAEDFFFAAVRFWVFVCCASGAAMLGLETHKHSALDTRNDSARDLRARISRRAAGENASPPRVPPVSRLAPQNRRRIGILAQGLWVSLTQDLNHPVIEVIDGVDQDRLKTPVIFFVSLFNIISQTQANVFMFASQTNVVGTEHFNILHGNFGDTIRPAV